MISPDGLRTINEFFTNKVYYIPNYQREYSWEDEQIDDFLLDLGELYESNDVEHFFGQVVMHVEKGSDGSTKNYIIDGQQRISTSMIFASVVYSKAKELENDQRNIGGDKNAEMLAGDVSKEMLGIGRSYSPRVNMGNIDKVFFEDNIIKANMKDDTIAKVPSHKLIKNAYTKIKEFVESMLATKTTYVEEVAMLCDLYDVFTQKFKMMTISTEDLEEAFVFFETLNARGKDLETSDLLKNHLFKNCTSHISTIEKQWNAMIEALEGNEPTKYIRTFWNSKYDHIREKQLYKEIRGKANSEAICMNLTADLLKYAPHYRVLVNPQSNANEFQNEEVIKVLEDLKMLKAKTFYPLILAMVEKNFSEDDILKVLKTIATIVFRNFTICGENPNSYETVYSEKAQQVFNGELKTVDEITADLQTLVIADETFEAAFIYENVNTTNARFILRKIENTQRSETETIQNNKTLHIEHIMPQSKEKWPQISDDTHKKYLNTIGNLTLLGKKLNQDASNKPFKDKKTNYYSQSEIKLTQALTQVKDWTPTDIEYRAKDLLKKAKMFWQ